MPTAYATEKVPFRLFSMPCCQHSLCWVNSRLPSFCPSCGKACYIQLRSEDHTVINKPAILKIMEG